MFSWSASGTFRRSILKSNWDPPWRSNPRLILVSWIDSGVKGRIFDWISPGRSKNPRHSVTIKIDNSFQPTLRIFSGDYGWCSLNHKSENDIEYFKSRLGL